MPVPRTRPPRSALCAIGLSAILGTAASSARADDEVVIQDQTRAPPRGRLGLGLGGSWPPVEGSAAVLTRVSVGLDVGRFSLRGLPTLEYAIVDDAPRRTLAAAYLAAEGALRITPGYAVSIAPLAGYASAPNPNFVCLGVCPSPLPLEKGWLLGLDVSPVTFVLGPDGVFEVGLHAILLGFPADGQRWLTGVVELRWIFASQSLGDRPHPAEPSAGGEP